MSYSERETKIEELKAERLPEIGEVKKECLKAHHIYELLNLEYKFRNHVMNKLSTNIYFAKEKYNKKMIIGSLFRNDEVNVNELKMIEELG